MENYYLQKFFWDLLSFDSQKFVDRIHFHYKTLTNIGELMDIMRTESPNFQPISYHAKIEETSILKKGDVLEDFAWKIGKGLVDSEFENFIFELKKAPCKTIKTTLENVVETLEQTHDELWDLGLSASQLFTPSVLKSEIWKRKSLTGTAINFSAQKLKPTLSNKLGHSQIIFSNKHCFGKTYPKTLDKQILVSVRWGSRNSEIDCQIIQNLHFRNLETMRRIVVIDSENSDFLIPEN